MIFEALGGFWEGFGRVWGGFGEGFGGVGGVKIRVYTHLGRVWAESIIGTPALIRSASQCAGVLPPAC